MFQEVVTELDQIPCDCTGNGIVIVTVLVIIIILIYMFVLRALIIVQVLGFTATGI
jgi:hypothetical protein